MKFTLSPGQWEWWVRDKETHHPLSPRLFVIKDNNITCEVDLDVSENLIDLIGAEIIVRRTR